MRRLILCAAIFLSVAAGSGVSLTVLKSSTDDVIGSIELMQSAHDAESRSKALEVLEEKWADYYSKSSFITREQTLEELSADVKRLKLLTGAELDGELTALKERVVLIYDGQFPHISGIL